jgi:preprotein translocase subunit YajC
MIDLAYAMGGQATGGQGAQLMALAPFILMFVVFYFLLIRPQQKKTKQHKTFLESLKRGDTVVTSGGIYGKITGITDDAVTMEIAEKVRVRVLKGAVADYVKGEQV